MMYLSGIARDGIPAMLTPNLSDKPPAGLPWAADNGRYSRPDTYTDERYMRWLTKMLPYQDRCLFAAAPDVWGDWTATLELSRPMLGTLRAAGWPVALCIQNGARVNEVPWDDIDAIFVGGTDAWRSSDEHLFAIIAEANRRGKWAHMGRVNSWRRMEYARSLGCDSVDGTMLRFDPTRPVAEWNERAQRQPHIWERSKP